MIERRAEGFTPRTPRALECMPLPAPTTTAPAAPTAPDDVQLPVCNRLHGPLVSSPRTVERWPIDRD